MDAPPARGDEGQAGALALDEEPHGHRLDPAGAEAGLDLAPEHRGDVVAEESVDDAPGLLGAHEVHVHIPSLGQGVFDGAPGDLVEDQAPHGDLGLEDLQEVPGDGLALAILIGCEVELRGLREQGLELLDLLAPALGQDVERLEAVLDIHRRARPLLPPVGIRDLRGALRQIAHVPDRGLDGVVIPEELGDGAGLGGGLDDDEGLAHGAPAEVGEGSGLGK